MRRLAQQARLPIVSANLRGPDGKLLFDADRLVEAAGVKVGLFSVTVPPSLSDAASWRATGIEAGDAVAATREEVASLRARGATLVVALLQVGGGPDNRRLLEAVPGIDWAVTGGSGLRLEDPERVASEPVPAPFEGRSPTPEETALRVKPFIFLFLFFMLAIGAAAQYAILETEAKKRRKTQMAKGLLMSGIFDRSSRRSACAAMVTRRRRANWTRAVPAAS